MTNVPDKMLLAIVDAVVDGLPVDWPLAEATPMSGPDRSLLAELRVLEELHRLHRSLQSPPSSDHAETMPTVSSNPGASLEPRPSEEDPTESSPIGHTWGRLEIREVLGAGGFGIVYRAWDPHLASEVALKVLTRDTTRSGATVIEEARLLARVRHPNIVSIYGADRVDGRVGLWMELVRGRTLRQVTRQQGPFGGPEAALIGLDLTRALAAVHAAGLVHRDVKPHNVMRDDRGRIVLMDFGAGVELETLAGGPQRQYVGTPVYMAPELFEGVAPTPQSDLYSLGILLYNLVSGEYPLEGATPGEVRLRHQRGERRRLRDVRPDLATEFVRIVEHAIEPDVRSRYQSAGELESDLARFVIKDGHRDRPAQPATRLRARVRRRILGAFAATALIAAAALTALTLWPLRPAPGPPGRGPIHSLAVMPFANLSGDSEQEYFADGMTDLLINELSMVSSLRVISRTSIMTYKGTRRPLADVARDLKVDGVVEGSAARSGDRLRVTARLVLAGTDAAAWAQSYERFVKDAFTLQAEIARDLAGGIRASVTGPESRRLQSTYAAPPEAQDSYLRGIYLMYQLNPDRQRDACDRFERAVQVDPNYAQAWSTLARCYTRLEEYGRLTPSQARQLVLRAAGTALAHDPTLAEAHLAAGDAKFKFDWNWQEAEENYQQAISLNPSFSFGRTQHARFLAAAGLTGEAVREAQEAERVDPVSAETTATLAMMAYYDRRWADAVAHADRALGINPRVGHTVRGRAYAAMGDYPRAIADFELALSRGEFPALLAELARTYAAAGRRAEAEAILGRLQAGSSVPAYSLAYVYAALGRPDEALAALERAVEDRSPGVLWLRVDPNADLLRGDPRFAALVRRIGGLRASPP